MNGLKFFWVIYILITGIEANAQELTIHVDHTSLREVIRIIENKTNYVFLYRTEIIKWANPVSIHARNATVDQVLKQVTRQTDLNYKIVGNMVVFLPPKPVLLQYETGGKVINEAGEALAGVTVSVNNSSTLTNELGEFGLMSLALNDTIYFSCVGYEPVKMCFNRYRNYFTVRLKVCVKEMDVAEVISTGYQKSKKDKTPGIFTLVENELNRRAAPSLSSALEGQVPGLLVTQSNGLPGSSYKIQLRGQSSIGLPGKLPASDPFFVVDGMPFAPNNNSLQTLTVNASLGAQAGNPLMIINPNDVEKIEVLKDAEATAIYGSRGANGVVLITTKKGKPGRPLSDVKFYSGISKITRAPDMLNTSQYVQMRREALTQDGLTPTEINAPDLLLLDTTRYTDFKKMLIGGTAYINNWQYTLSGGSSQTQYLVGLGSYRETTVFPASLSYARNSLHTHVTHQSVNNKFSFDVVSIFTSGKDNWIIKDLTNFLTLPPNTPDLYDWDNRLNWQYKGVSFTNPLAFLHQPHITRSFNSLLNVQLSYSIAKPLTVKVNFGYNSVNTNETSIVPGKSQNPFISGPVKGSADFANNSYAGWIVEPQVHYAVQGNKAKYTLSIGGTLQQLYNQVKNIAANGFDNDDQLYDISAANSVTESFDASRYKYRGLFSRLTCLWKDKYGLTLTGRQDASSRFNPAKQTGNFGAIGASWTFGHEPFIKKSLPFVSHGKVRGSYGIVGDDHIIDYKNTNTWQQTTTTYVGNTGIVPVLLTDDNLTWQINQKLEAGLELSLFKDQLNMSVTWYRNRNGNQIIQYTVPGITGFASVIAKNSSAVVQNKGWEMLFQFKSSKSRFFQLNHNITLTIPQNKLLAFPDLAGSTYASLLVVGQSLTVQQGYRYKGVNPVTGLFEVADLDKDGKTSYPNDYRVIGNLDPKLYGSFETGMAYKNWELNIFLEGRVQKAPGYLYQVYNYNSPGTSMVNQPVAVLARWQKPGDHSTVQRFSATASTTASNAINNFLQSDALLSNASYLRVKNVYLAYTLPRTLLDKCHLKNCRIYLSAGNWFTITSYKGTDPETQNIFTLPPLKTLVAGLQCSF